MEQLNRCATFDNTARSTTRLTFDGKNSGNVSDLVRVKFMIGCLLAPGGKVFVFVLTYVLCLISLLLFKIF